MAIYKNREVQILGVNVQSNTPETINVAYKDGTRENVHVSGVLFTEDEKKNLLKKYPSKYEDIRTVTDSDVEAVRAGVAPSFDPSYKEAAELKVQKEKQDEILKKNQDMAKKEAEKSSKDQPKTPTNFVNAPTPMNSKAR